MCFRYVVYREKLRIIWTTPAILNIGCWSQAACGWLKHQLFMDMVGTSLVGTSLGKLQKHALFRHHCLKTCFEAWKPSPISVPVPWHPYAFMVKSWLTSHFLQKCPQPFWILTEAGGLVTLPGQKAVEGFRTSAGGMEAQCQSSEDGQILGWQGNLN